jgi:quercetin dioxygenase-like cupin family protein
MTPSRVIVNPLSGEQIVILRTAAQTDGAVLDWELTLAPGGKVPSSHAHPAQEEVFTILEGTMRFRIGRRRLTATGGDVVRIPPGVVHHFANAGHVPARVAVESRPALAMEELLKTAAALAQEQHRAGRALPRPLELALFMADFEREVRAPIVPGRLMRPAMRRLAGFARRHGLDNRYRVLRTRR